MTVPKENLDVSREVFNRIRKAMSRKSSIYQQVEFWCGTVLTKLGYAPFQINATESNLVVANWSIVNERLLN